MTPVGLTAGSRRWRRGTFGRPGFTTALLGKAKVTGEAYENADGSPLKIATDYFDNKRNPANPFPGPFEITETGKQNIKVWPKPEAAGSN